MWKNTLMALCVCLACLHFSQSCSQGNPNREFKQESGSSQESNSTEPGQESAVLDASNNDQKTVTEGVSQTETREDASESTQDATAGKEALVEKEPFDNRPVENSSNDTTVMDNPTPESSPDMGSSAFGSFRQNTLQSAWGTIAGAGFAQLGTTAFVIALSSRTDACRSIRNALDKPKVPYYGLALVGTGQGLQAKTYTVGNGIKAEYVYDDGSGEKRVTATSGTVTVTALTSQEVRANFSLTWNNGKLEGTVVGKSCFP